MAILGKTAKIHPKVVTPFWDPNFSPPCGQLAAPYLFAHREPRPNFKLYTEKES